MTSIEKCVPVYLSRRLSGLNPMGLEVLSGPLPFWLSERNLNDCLCLLEVKGRESTYVCHCTKLRLVTWGWTGVGRYQAVLPGGAHAPETQTDAVVVPLLPCKAPSVWRNLLTPNGV